MFIQKTTSGLKSIDGKLTLSTPNRLQNCGRVNDLIIMFNSKSANEKMEQLDTKIVVL